MRSLCSVKDKVFLHCKDANLFHKMKNPRSVITIKNMRSIHDSSVYKIKLLEDFDVKCYNMSSFEYPV